MRLARRFGEQATIADRLALEAHPKGITIAELSNADRVRASEGFYGLRWAGFEITGDERDDPIEVVDYDPEWPRTFTRWRARLAAALGPVAKRIEHVGSTGVVGLAGKPIVDIQVSVIDLETEDSYVPAIDHAGVALRSRDANHRYFRPPPGIAREVHVHVCSVGGPWEREHLLFRDYLRAHADVRDGYAKLKRDLVAEFRDDRLRYTEAKSDFIRAAMGDAEHWAAGLAMRSSPRSGSR